MDKHCHFNMKLMLVINIFSLLTAASSQVFKTQELNDATCEGSLVVVDSSGNKQVFKDDEKDVKINVAEVYVELCGCYNIYSKKKFKGREDFVTVGKTLTKEDFKLIKSIERTSCDIHASSNWQVIAGVVVAVLVVGVVAVLLVKTIRSRRHSALPQDDSSV